MTNRSPEVLLVVMLLFGLGLGFMLGWYGQELHQTNVQLAHQMAVLSQAVDELHATSEYETTEQLIFGRSSLEIPWDCPAMFGVNAEALAGVSE